MLHEFDLIHRYFKPLGECADSGVSLGIGDDAALVQCALGETLVVSTDTLVAGVHFPFETSPQDIAYKALMVNASDVIAMGGRPRWFLLSISAPEITEAWIEPFTQGAKEALSFLNATLIGGDTTKGPVLSLTIQVLGTLTGEALLRSRAKVGDSIGVTGPLGGAAFALTPAGKKNVFAQRALNRPRARLEYVESLKKWANSAIDISDGVAQDLLHILNASNVGATLFLKDFPLADCLRDMPRNQALNLGLSGGDDYELLVTVSPENREALRKELSEKHLDFFEIGVITPEKGLRLFDLQGKQFVPEKFGYEHFGVSEPQFL